MSENLNYAPWFIGNSLVLVRSWIPNFSPSSFSKISTVWINIPHLPIEYVYSDILKILGNSIGKTIAFDANNLNCSLVSSVRLCLEINLDSNLPNLIVMNDLSLNIIYENLTIIQQGLNSKSLGPLLPTPAHNPHSNFLPLPNSHQHKLAVYSKHPYPNKDKVSNRSS